MGSVYPRKDSPFLWWSYAGPTGKRIARRSPYRRGQERAANSALGKIEFAIATRTDSSTSDEVPTLNEYAERWTCSRKKQGIRNHAEEARHLRLHILPRFGELPVTGITKAHVKELLAALIEQDKAPRTIRNVHSTLRSVFSELIDEEIVEHNPCDVHRKHLGRSGDKDPEWRASAIYTRDEIIRIISDPALPPDRRVLYMISFFTGLRLGEIAGTCWRHWQDASPASKLLVAHSYKNTTKTDIPREVPVHPLLELVLAGWRAQGFEDAVGWVPTPDDHIVPSPCSRGGNGAHRHRKAGTIRTKNQIGKRFRRDLELVGIPHRRFHDTRRTFISLAQADGAQREHLLPVTHTGGSTRAAFDLYTTIPWSTRSNAVASFRPVPPSNYSELARWILAKSGCYASCYVAKKVPDKSGTYLVEAPGVEPGSASLLTGHLRA